MFLTFTFQKYAKDIVFRNAGTLYSGGNIPDSGYL